MNKKEINTFCLNFIIENSFVCYILEVDLGYRPEKLEITQNMLSKYCSDVANKYGTKIGGVN